MNSQTQKFLDVFNTIDFNRIKDHPNILIAANFWEEERFLAAKVCYRLMRMLDDLIDNFKAENKIITDDGSKHLKSEIDKWLRIIYDSNGNSSIGEELIKAVDRFIIPSWPLEAFAKSMIYDTDHNGFATIESFIEYSFGASVAPASIFVHLNSIRRVNGVYVNPLFDVKWASTPCAFFSYIVHIIRDFQKDQMNNLNYFADELIFKYGLTRESLREFAEGAAVNDKFRNLIRHYYALADNYRKKTNEVLQSIQPLLEPRYKLSLEIIFNLYLMVFERIKIEDGSFTTKELCPGTDEIKERVYDTILNFD
jgi:phytoene/squalene synthetase